MPRYTFTDIFKLLFTPVVIAPFLIGTLALGVASAAVYDLLQDKLGNDVFSHLRILVLSAIILVTATFVFYLAFAMRSRERLLAINKPHPLKRKGLVFLVSQRDTLHKAFAYHQPVLERCWLIATSQSWMMATEFKSQHENEIHKIELVPLRDEFDWEECKNIIDGIYQQLPAGWQIDDAITDFTGLTKLATAGAILASMAADRPMQYVPGIYEEQEGRRVAIEPTDPIEIVIDRQIVFNAPQSRLS